MTFWLSKPVEELLEKSQGGSSLTADIVVVGSGYGAAMAALALSDRAAGVGPGPVIWVLERGGEYVPGDFPTNIGDLPRHVSVAHRGARFGRSAALFDFRTGRGVAALVGCGLGGTSLINANVAMPPTSASFRGWPHSGVPWPDRLQNSIRTVKEELAVAPHPRGTEIDKYKALQKFGECVSLDSSSSSSPNNGGTTTGLADITVKFESGQNDQGVQQEACTNCGNCVTGCNIGAKNSLNMNVWPKVQQRGVELYTGAQVAHVERNAEGDYPWLIHTALAADNTKVFKITAKTVILAAGTFGSTEILLRTRAATNLQFSNRLGERFSTNGDSIAASIGQSRKVSGISKEPSFPGYTKASTHSVGPTIVGATTMELEDGAEVLVEDATIPFALRHVFDEVVATGAFLSRYTSSARSSWHASHPDHDPVAVNPDLSDHTQTLLFMGIDAGNGSIDLGTDCAFPNMADGESVYYESLHRRLVQAHEGTGVAGGTYLANPAHKPLPDGFEESVEGGGEIGGNQISVHPLGGCAMGANAHVGVVNNRGAVFVGGVGERKDGENTASPVHEGLYVLDGSIIPGAIGVNPFLTIAALAHTLAGEIVLPWEDQNRAPGGDSESTKRWPPAGRYYPVSRTVDAARECAMDDSVTAVFRERLYLKFRATPAEVQDQQSSSNNDPELDSIDKNDVSGRECNFQCAQDPVEEQLSQGDLERLFKFCKGGLNGYHALVLDVEISWPSDANAVCEPKASIYAWLANPDQKLAAKLRLKGSTRQPVNTIEQEDLRDFNREFTGWVNLGRRDPARYLLRIARAVAAAWHAWRLNPGGRILSNTRSERGSCGIFGTLKRLIRSAPQLFPKLQGLYRVAALHADRRVLDYWFCETGEQRLHLSGQKELAFAPCKPNIWTALFELPLIVHSEARTPHKIFRTEHKFLVDFVRITKGPSPIQVLNAPHTPEAASAMLGLGLYYARAITQTHFWSFRALDYTAFGTKREENRRRLETLRERVTYVPGDSRLSDESAKVEIWPSNDGLSRLLRYRPSGRHLARTSRNKSEHCHVEPVLLIHGLAQGSEFFLTTNIEKNMVQYLLGDGFDVWVLDYRSSANLHEHLVPGIDMDQVAETDIPWAVSTVYEQHKIELGDAAWKELGKPGIKVFSHCIGSGCLSIAILRGLLDRPKTDDGGTGRSSDIGEPRSMIDALVSHAVTPWLYASRHNRLRANVFATLKDVERIFGDLDVLDPIPHNERSFTEIMFDRLAGSLPWPEEQWARHRNDERCRGFSRGLCNRMTIYYGRDWKHTNLTQETHRDLASINGPAPLNILRQFHYSVIRGRLTSSTGKNEYVQTANFTQHWKFPTLFIHGQENEVLDVESSRLSAHLFSTLRSRGKALLGFSGPKVALDQQQIGLQIFPNYGHMDVVFGHDAHRTVFPHIAKFLREYDKDLSYYKCAAIPPKSKTAPSELPMTGPVISLPEFSECKHKGYIQVWGETNEFVTSTSKGIEIVTRAGNKSKQAISLPHRQAKDDYRFTTALVDPVVAKNETLLARIKYSPKGAAQSGTNSGVYSATGMHQNVKLSPNTPAPSKNTNPRATQAQSLSAFEFKWHTMPWFKRHLSRNEEQAVDELKLSFAAGSCLYPGTTFEQEYSDRIFRGVFHHATSERGDHSYGLDHILLLGDQIYADATADLFDPGNFEERYRHRYQRAFGGMSFINEQGKNAREVFSRLPTYFAVDDHEIENNWGTWPDTAEEPDSEKKLKSAKESIICYQMPNCWGQNSTRDRFWYDFVSRGIPFFVFDTRTQRRNHRDRLCYEAVICQEQLDDFRSWVDRTRGAPIRFVASGSPIAPIPSELEEFSALTHGYDNLLAFPGFLAKVATILHGQRGIVWLSGDPHFSSCSNLSLSFGKSKVRLVHVVASGLCATVPFINQQLREYRWFRAGHSPASQPANVTWSELPDLQLTCIEQQWITNSPRHFVRIDVTPKNGVKLFAFDHDGKPTGQSFFFLPGGTFNGGA